MIDPASRLHNTVSSELMVSNSSRGVPPQSQSFAEEFSGQLARTTESASSLQEPRASQKTVTGQASGVSSSSAASTTTPISSTTTGAPAAAITSFPATRNMSAATRSRGRPAGKGKAAGKAARTAAARMRLSSRCRRRSSSTCFSRTSNFPTSSRRR